AWVLLPANAEASFRAGHGAMDSGAGPDQYLQSSRSSYPDGSDEMTAVDLNGTTVVVTGASRGFGRATAVALAKSGAHVVGVARHRGGLGGTATRTRRCADLRDRGRGRP